MRQPERKHFMHPGGKVLDFFEHDGIEWCLHTRGGGKSDDGRLEIDGVDDNGDEDWGLRGQAAYCFVRVPQLLDRIAALEKAVKAADSALGDLYWSDDTIDCMSSTWAAWLKRKAIYDAARAPLGEIK